MREINALSEDLSIEEIASAAVEDSARGAPAALESGLPTDTSGSRPADLTLWPAVMYFLPRLLVLRGWLA